MRKLLLCVCLGLLSASEDKLQEAYPQKQLPLTKEQKILLQESLKQERNNEESKASPKNKPMIKGSTQLQKTSKTEQQKRGDKASFENPYEGFSTKEQQEENAKPNLSFEKKWIYGTAVITTTFLDGSIKRSYGVLLRDGMFVTSANMVYDRNVYARVSYAMMQDDSSIPFICVASLSIKALDLQKGLAILETSAFTDIYCNQRKKSYYHDRIYSQYWVNVFDEVQQKQQAIVYAPYITKLNSFATEQYILQESLDQLAQKENHDFEGYKYAYGKGFYTHDGRLLGIIGASSDSKPKFIPSRDIADFLCELKERKILKNSYLQVLCPSSKKKE
ncbi:hypothetical protein [Helicobacter pametensis]|uniref:hypothetical protein n=1 Tax=Helicobacter pametensis TaxID=95149 RepID=UPI0004B363D1|nr:hypothetical protein [Helicobacter pametensis]